MKSFNFALGSAFLIALAAVAHPTVALADTNKAAPTAPAAGTIRYAIAEDPKFINIAFESRMDVEDILGTTRSATGFAELSGKSGSFEIKIPVASLKTGIELRDEHLRSAQWLDAAKFPDITFRGSGVTAKGDGKYELTGDLVVHGVAQKVTLVADTKAIPEATGKKLGLPGGDWLRIRSAFTIKLSSHGVKIPSMAAAKVSDEWSVSVSLFAKQAK
jgi:polyisoprenoid-binding protein YceI